MAIYGWENLRVSLKGLMGNYAAAHRKLLCNAVIGNDVDNIRMIANELSGKSKYISWNNDIKTRYSTKCPVCFIVTACF
jgi:hypothetical protein